MLKKLDALDQLKNFGINNDDEEKKDKNLNEKNNKNSNSDLEV